MSKKLNLLIQTSRVNLMKKINPIHGRFYTNKEFEENKAEILMLNKLCSDVKRDFEELEKLNKKV